MAGTEFRKGLGDVQINVLEAARPAALASYKQQRLPLKLRAGAVTIKSQLMSKPSYHKRRRLRKWTDSKSGTASESVQFVIDFYNLHPLHQDPSITAQVLGRFLRKYWGYSCSVRYLPQDSRLRFEVKKRMSKEKFHLDFGYETIAGRLWLKVAHILDDYLKGSLTSCDTLDEAWPPRVIIPIYPYSLCFIPKPKSIKIDGKDEEIRRAFMIFGGIIDGLNTVLQRKERIKRCTFIRKVEKNFRLPPKHLGLRRVGKIEYCENIFLPRAHAPKKGKNQVKYCPLCSQHRRQVALYIEEREIKEIEEAREAQKRAQWNALFTPDSYSHNPYFDKFRLN